MTRTTKCWILIGLWFVLTVALLLAPTPRGMGDFGRRFSVSYDEIKSVLQPTVHFLVMAVGAFLLMQLFVKWPSPLALLVSVGMAIVVAYTLELCQDSLPEYFARACDMYDLVPSLGGAIIGAGASLFFRPRRAENIVSN